MNQDKEVLFVLKVDWSKFFTSRYEFHSFQLAVTFVTFDVSSVKLDASVAILIRKEMSCDKVRRLGGIVRLD